MTKQEAYLGLAILACVLCALGGYVLGRAVELMGSWDYSIHSDTRIRGLIENKAGPLPDEIRRLYYARCGFQDAQYFMAFTVSESGLRSVYERLGNAKLPFPTPAKRDVLDRIRKRSPPALNTPADKNWDIREKTDLLILEHTADRTVVFSPSERRVYWCRW